MRDIGGHTTGFGTRVRRGRLFRWSACAETDFGDPRRLGLGSVFDTAATPREFLSRRGWVTRAFYEIPLVEPMHTAGSSELEVLLESSASVAELLAILTDPGAYPTAIGASSGVDHTGALTAVLLSWLGVPDDEIAPSLSVSPPGPGSEPALLDAVRDEFGSVDGFAQVLGLGSALHSLRDALLVDGSRAHAV